MESHYQESTQSYGAHGSMSVNPNDINILDTLNENSIKHGVEIEEFKESEQDISTKKAKRIIKQTKRIPYEEEVPPDVLDSITFCENIQIDWKTYPILHRKCWDTQKNNEELKQYPRKEFHVSDSIQLLHESIEFLFKYVDNMNLHDKDIFIVVGPSRTGKGTLLAALKG